MDTCMYTYMYVYMSLSIYKDIKMSYECVHAACRNDVVSKKHHYKREET